MECAILGIVVLVFFFCQKYIFAALTILFGDKEALKEYGDLCENDKIWDYSPKYPKHKLDGQ